MLNGLSGQELINKNSIQNNELEKISLTRKNPYSDIDKNLLVDETDISKEALNLYQKDLDIQKFTSLALSDPENQDCNILVLNNVFNANDDIFDNKIIEGIFNNKTFLNDLLG